MRSLPPSKPLTGPAPPRRSVCAGNDGLTILSQTNLEWENDHVIPQLAAEPPIRPRIEPGPTPSPATGLAASPPPSLEFLEDRCLLSFTPVASYAGTTALVADFNNDTVPDLVRNGGSVLLGNGDGTFDPAPGPAVYGSAVGDFDGDGNLDLVASDGSGVNVLMGNGDGTFTPGGSIILTDPDSEASVASVAVGDFNGDGNLDLGVTSNFVTIAYDPWYGYFDYYTSFAHVLLGNGSGGFSGQRQTTTDIGPRYNGSAAAADINSDGFDDLMTDLSVLPGDASGFLQTPIDYNAAGVFPVVAADVDGDLDIDLVAPLYGGIGVMLGNGTFYGMGFQHYATGSYHTSAAVADVNGDGKLDIVSTSNSTENLIFPYNPIYRGRLDVLLGYGDGTFANAITQDLGIGFASGLVASDFNGDGLADLVVRHSAQCPTVFLNTGGWNAQSAVAISDAMVTEGDSGTVDAVFTVTRKGNLDGTVTVDYFTGDYDATAGKDFVAQSGTLTFGPGETTKTITIKVKGDLIDEYDQVFGVYLGATGVQITNGNGICTIVDNDPPPTVTITPKVSAKEGNTGTKTLTFIVTLSAPSEKEIRVNFATANGTASTTDNDYVANSGTLVFAPGKPARPSRSWSRATRKRNRRKRSLLT